jgi:hypothetical protein
VDDKIVATIVAFRRQFGATSISPKLFETAANLPCHGLYEKCGFEKNEGIWVTHTESVFHAEAYSWR